MTALAPSPSGDRFRSIADGRGNRVRVDCTAFRRNVAATRALLPTGTRLYQVVKGDGYGFGLDAVVSLGLDADVDGFCAGTPDEALRIRGLAPGAFVLLFTASPPDTLPDLAGIGITVTVNSVEAFEALLASDVKASVFVELECGFGRFGLELNALDSWVERYKAQDRIRLLGAYTHLGQSNPVLLSDGLRVFEDAVSLLRARVGHEFETMVASSHTILERPDLPYQAVDPGRLLYGIVDEAHRKQFAPVLAGMTSTLIQLHRHDEERRVLIGYSDEISLPPGGATGVFPLGWYDGLPSRGPLGEVMVNGRRVRVVARTLLHSIVDLSDVPQPQIGDQVILVGEDLGQVLSIDAAAEAMGMSATELHFRVAGSIAGRRRHASN